MTVLRFFGEPWPSGVCAGGVQVETPVGYPCKLCSHAVIDGDQGWYIGAVELIEDKPMATQGPAHRECVLRSTMGGPLHLQKRCSCYGGANHDSGMTFREEALWVWEYVTSNPNYDPTAL